MKNGLLILLLAFAGTANAQTQPKSLKDLLYSGKLKMDSTGVVRKGDDLSTKIDTTTKVPVEPAIPRAPLTDTLAVSANVADSATDAGAVIKAPSASPRSNTKIWKEYTDTLVSSLKAGVLTSKKIKKETYFVTVDYEINTDGSVNVTSVVSRPANAVLQSEVSNRMELAPLQLAPVLDSSNQPRKVKRKHNFSVTKD